MFKGKIQTSTGMGVTARGRCRLVFLIPIFAAALLALSRPLHALSVTPTVQIFDLKPGDKKKGEYIVTNDDQVMLTVTPSVKEWFDSKDNKERGIVVDQWLSVKKDSFVLKPGESRKVSFEAKAPKKAVGEVVGMVSFLMENEEEKYVNKRFSVAVYVGIQGTLKAAAEIKGITVELSTGSLAAGFILRNRGNFHVRPEGLIAISDEKNNNVANISIKRSSPAHAGQLKTYYGTLEKFTLAPGEYTATIAMEDLDRGAPIAQVVKKFTVTKDKKVEAK